MGITKIFRGNYVRRVGGNLIREADDKIEVHARKNILNYASEGVQQYAAKIIDGQYENPVEKQVVEMYWSYGEDYTRLAGKSRFYIDMNLHVKTINYEPGETVSVSLSLENGNSIMPNMDKMVLTGQVNEDNTVVFKEVFKDYTLNLTGEEEE